MSANDQDGESVIAAHDGAPSTPVPTGNLLPGVRELQEVDAALAGLIDLPVGAQVAVFTDLHQRLTAALAVTATAGAADESPRARTDDVEHAGNMPEPRRQQQPLAPEQRPGQPQHRPGPQPHRGS